jgi:hypothetical protein
MIDADLREELEVGSIRCVIKPAIKKTGSLSYIEEILV